MKTYSSLIINRQKVSPLLISSTLCCILLLSFRIKYTNTSYFLFLVWNLFLAGIPFLLSTYLLSISNISKTKVAFTSILWLLFLPNAPYIVTDLYHLRLSAAHLVWLDALVIFSFAGVGVLLFYISLCDMYSVWCKLITKQFAVSLIYCTCFLSGFGIYLGRFLRYNSWEILSNPIPLLQDCLAFFLAPKTHSDFWAFTLVTGCVLSVGFYAFKKIMITTI